MPARFSLFVAGAAVVKGRPKVVVTTVTLEMISFRISDVSVMEIYSR